MSVLEEWENTVQCMDCLEGMKQLPDGCVDLVVTDPPFNVGMDYGAKYNDDQEKGKYLVFMEEWLNQSLNLTTESGRLYFFSPDKWLFDLREIIDRVGWKFVQLLVWYGPNMPGGTKISLDWHPLHEFIFLCRKGKRTPMLNAGALSNCHSVLVYTRPQRNFTNGRWHPAQKPLKLIKALIARSPGNLILDPFMGSGTTALACKQLGRRFIGFEINPKYVEICNQRLAQEVMKL